MLVLCRIHLKFRGGISGESVGLRGAENFWCCLDLEFLGACRNDVVYQTLTTETDKGFHGAQ